MDIMSKATLDSVTAKIYKGKKCKICDKEVDDPEDEKWGKKPKVAPMPKLPKV